MNVLAVSGLRKSYGDFCAVDSLDFTVSAGDIYGFLGPNGAGKSTTLRMLAGLIHPSSGSMAPRAQHLPQPARPRKDRRLPPPA